MRKPNNYENTQVQGEFTPVELGRTIFVQKRNGRTKQHNIF